MKWSMEETDVVKKKFEKFLHLKRLPGKSECENLIKQNEVLKNRTWRNIKDFVRNQTVALERSMKKGN